MSDVPERPSGVPDEAVWVEEDQEWELGGLSDSGNKDGPYKYWRPDGTLCNECIMVEGAPHGPFKRFHENGEISQDGEFVDGELHGTRRWFACEDPTTERMHEGGIAETVWRSEMDYVHGNVVAIRHFDRDGERVLPSGEAYPERPSNVDDGAEFDERNECWVLGEAKGDGSKTGLWTWWNPDGTFRRKETYDDGAKAGPAEYYDESGTLREEGTYQDDERAGPWRRYDETGDLVIEATFADGVIHGDYTERFVSDEFDVSGVDALKGEFAQGTAVGTWRLVDSDGTTLLERDFGHVPTDEDELRGAAVFSNALRTAEGWKELAQSLDSEQRYAESFIALARAAAVSCDLAPLSEGLEKRSLCKTPEGAQSEAAGAVNNQSDSVVILTNCLLRGGSPAPLLRCLAIQMDMMNRGHVALELVNAALLADPTRTDFLFTRGLVLMRLGLNGHAHTDGEALAEVQPDAAQFLIDYNRVLFPRFGFWAGNSEPETHYDGLPDGPEQSLEVITATIRKYALRMTRLRAAILAHLKEPMDWVPPDVSHLVDDSVSLSVDSFSFEDEDGDEIEVDIDEDLQTDGYELPDLLRMARADWNALTWLCWSVGLSDVGIPSESSPPPDFGKAAGMAVQRLWRCRDKVHMNGWGAQQSDSPTFEWEGLDIDEMPGQLASIAEQQYAEMAALFRWLTDTTHRSPWQDNLRGS